MANFTTPVLYAVPATTYKTALFLYSAGTKREMVYEMEFGQNGSYATTDISLQWDFSRAATPGIVGSTAFANALDTADYVAATLTLNLISTEPTYTTAGNGLSLKNWGINQRGSYRWRALDDGDNIIMPATAGVGGGLRQLCPGGPLNSCTAVGNVSFIER